MSCMNKTIVRIGTGTTQRKSIFMALHNPSAIHLHGTQKTWHCTIQSIFMQQLCESAPGTTQRKNRDMTGWISAWFPGSFPPLALPWRSGTWTSGSWTSGSWSFARDCSGNQNAQDCSGLLGIARDCSGLLGIARDCSELLGLAGLAGPLKMNCPFHFCFS